MHKPSTLPFPKLFQSADNRLRELAFVAGGGESHPIDFKCDGSRIGKFAHPVGQRVRSPKTEEYLLGTGRHLRSICNVANQMTIQKVAQTAGLPDEGVGIEVLVSRIADIDEFFISSFAVHKLIELYRACIFTEDLEIDLIVNLLIGRTNIGEERGIET